MVPSLESLVKELVKKVERLDIEVQKLKNTEGIKCLMNKYGTLCGANVLRSG